MLVSQIRIPLLQYVFPQEFGIQILKTLASVKRSKVAPFISTEGRHYLTPPHHNKNIAHSEITINEMLKIANYKPAHLGKWHLLSGGPESQGHDLSYGVTSNKYAAKFSDPNPVFLYSIIERAKKFINESKN